MTLCDNCRVGRIRLLSGLCALAGCSALSFAIGCNGGKTTGDVQPKAAATTAGAATPKVETKFLCKRKAFGEDHYFVDLTAKTARTDSEVAGGPNGRDKWGMKQARITEDAISFTQQIDFGSVTSLDQ